MCVLRIECPMDTVHSRMQSIIGLHRMYIMFVLHIALAIHLIGLYRSDKVSHYMQKAILIMLFIQDESYE